MRASFVPPPEIRRLRDFTRLRKAQVNERARVIQRLEKVLQEAGIKLTSVASALYSPMCPRLCAEPQARPGANVLRVERWELCQAV